MIIVVDEHYLAFGDKKRGNTRVYKKIKSDELKKDRKSHSNYCQRENDTRNKRNLYKDAAKFHNKMYRLNKLPEWKYLSTDRSSL